MKDLRDYNDLLILTPFVALVREQYHKLNNENSKKDANDNNALLSQCKFVEGNFSLASELSVAIH